MNTSLNKIDRTVESFPAHRAKREARRRARRRPTALWREMSVAFVLARNGVVEYDIGVPTFMNTATRQFGVVRGARHDDRAQTVKLAQMQ